MKTPPADRASAIFHSARPALAKGVVLVISAALTSLANTQVSAAPDDLAAIRVEAVNPSVTARKHATLVLTAATLAKTSRARTWPVFHVVDERGGRALVTQPVDIDSNGSVDEWVFQSDFASGETKVFRLETGAGPIPSRSSVFGRVVQERKDDFAWENDRIAFRIYGRRVEDELVSSGVDVWAKRTRNLVIDRWYARGDYHTDHGEGLDAYSVGISRGCGGTGVLIGDRLATSRNFVAARVISKGPIRFVFEVFYEPWAADGRSIVETKRITLDVGSNLSRYECRFSASDSFDDLQLTAGLARKAAGDARIEARDGWMRVWEPLVGGGSGSIGLGLVLPPEAAPGFSWRELPGHLLASVAAQETKTLTYYAGAGWDRSGDFADRDAWDAYLSAFARELREPIRISLTRTP